MNGWLQSEWLSATKASSLITLVWYLKWKKISKLRLKLVLVLKIGHKDGSQYLAKMAAIKAHSDECFNQWGMNYTALTSRNMAAQILSAMLPGALPSILLNELIIWVLQTLSQDDENLLVQIFVAHLMNSIEARFLLKCHSCIVTSHSWCLSSEWLMFCRGSSSIRPHYAPFSPRVWLE